MMFSMFKRKPDHGKWKPCANADDRDEITAYKIAAEKIGVNIKIGYAVPCPAGRDYCASLGMVGIYIDRQHASRENELTTEYHNAKMAMSM